ncbi:hypothetical protein BGX23_009310 [Mortierella sp. AD031]|nr:hypothetical protein BGX23_009310 [Mortierella sp. AD031]KAG0205124.1 hypothetical protein BGX33_008093 [Mortierella sp. NVP41]
MIGIRSALSLMCLLLGSTIPTFAAPVAVSETDVVAVDTTQVIKRSFNPRQKWQSDELNCVQILNPAPGATYRPGYFVRLNYGAGQCDATAAGPWTIHLYNNLDIQGGKVSYDYHEVIASGINEYRTQYLWTIPSNQNVKAKGAKKAGDYYVRIETNSQEGVKLVGNAGPFAIYSQDSNGGLTTLAEDVTQPLEALKRREDVANAPNAALHAEFALHPNRPPPANEAIYTPPTPTADPVVPSVLEPVILPVAPSETTLVDVTAPSDTTNPTDVTASVDVTIPPVTPSEITPTDTTVPMNVTAPTALSDIASDDATVPVTPSDTTPMDIAAPVASIDIVPKDVTTPAGSDTTESTIPANINISTDSTGSMVHLKDPNVPAVAIDTEDKSVNANVATTVPATDSAISATAAPIGGVIEIPKITEIPDHFDVPPIDLTNPNGKIPEVHNTAPTDEIHPPITDIAHTSFIPSKVLVATAVGGGAVGAGVLGASFFGQVGGVIGAILGGVVGGVAVLLHFLGFPV